MKPRETVELFLIALASGMVGLSGRFLPDAVGTGTLLTTACLIWLIQGGVRDLWLLHEMKTRPAATPKRKLACLCLESSVGLTGVLAGVALAVSGLGGSLTLTPGRWMALTAVVMTVGFLAKDFVITFRPLGIRRDPDHHSIIFSWRGK